MLARLLKQPNLLEQWAERRVDSQHQAVVLPFSRPKSLASQADWYAQYPCTRMHGADFEAEFYPAEVTF